MENMSKKSFDGFNLKENGADITGVSNSNAVFAQAVSSGKVIYLPAGTVMLTSVSLTENIEVIGNGELSVLKITGEVLTTKNITFRNLTLEFNTTGYFSIRTATSRIRLINCTIQSGHIFIDTAERFHVYGCTLNEVITQIKACPSFLIEGNEYDNNYTNTEEVIHVNETSSGEIKGNHFFNSGIDFIDLYVNNENVILSDNLFNGVHSSFMEIKAIYRDEGSGYGNETNKVGAWKNYIIKNNIFTGAINGSLTLFNLTTEDLRATPVINDEVNYPRNLIFNENIIIDNNVGDAETSNRTIFGISGMRNLKFNNNIISMNIGNKSVFYFNPNYTATTYQTSKRIEIVGTVLDLIKGSTTTTPSIKLIRGGYVDTLNVERNTLSDDAVLVTASYPLYKAVFQNNSINGITGTVYNVEIKGANSNVTFVRCDCGKCQIITGAGSSVIFDGNSIINTLIVGISMSLLRIINSKVENLTVSAASLLVINSGVTIDMMILGFVSFLKSTGFYINNSGTVTIYQAYANYCDTARASIWTGTVPTKLDQSTLY